MGSGDFVTYVNRHLRTAGWHAAQMRAGVEIQTKSAADDFVTQADKEVDVMVSAALGRLLPGCAEYSLDSALPDGLITEESIGELSPAVARAVASRPHVWYFDALDGTDNYVKEDGQYSILLGLVVDGEPAYGWVYAPARDELYFGGPPSEIATSFGYPGLWRKRGNSWPEQLLGSLPDDGPSTGDRVSAVTGLAANDVSSAGAGQSVAGVLCERLRVIMGSRDRRDNPSLVERIKADDWVSVGSLGLKVIALINGAADVYVHVSRKLKFWDTAAPFALAKAAGLTICDFDGAPIEFKPQAQGSGDDISRHRQTVLIGTPAGVKEARRRFTKDGNY